MHILFVTMQLGPGYTQGTERYVTSLGGCLARRGHEVSYLAGDPLGLHKAAQTTPSRHRPHGPERLGDTLGPLAGGELYALPTRGWMTVVGETESLAGWLRSKRPDVVHVANPAHVGVGIIAAARSLGIPVVVTAMDFWWVCPKATLLRGEGGICDGTPPWRECVRCIAADHPRPGVRWLARVPPSLGIVSLALFYARSRGRGLSVRDAGLWARRREELAAALQSVHTIIFPSSATRAAIEPILSGTRCELIPYGLSPEWFESPRLPASSPIPPEQMVIGFAGALLPHKAPHLLLEAVRRLGWTTTRVRLAGPSPDAGYAQQLRAAAAGLNVEFTGALETAKMPAFLRSLDLLAMTSTWPENLPFIVLEAQAAGVPVVGSRLPGIADQIADDRLGFAPGSAEALGAAIDWVRRHPEQITIPPVQGIDEMTDRTQAVYASALGGVTGEQKRSEGR